MTIRIDTRYALNSIDKFDYHVETPTGRRYRIRGKVLSPGWIIKTFDNLSQNFKDRIERWEFQDCLDWIMAQETA